MNRLTRALHMLALALCLIQSPQALAAADIAAANLSGRGGVAPELATLAQLDRQIAANQHPKEQQALMLQRHALLERLTGRIFAGDTADLAPSVSATSLQRLRIEVERVRRDSDETREMIAVLKLNTAVLDAAFAELLRTLARQWSSFASKSAFERSFIAFHKRTKVDQQPFKNAVTSIEALPAAQRSPEQTALASAYSTYQQRADTYDAVLASLQDFIVKAAGGDTVLREIGVGRLIATVNDLDVISAANAALFPAGRMTLGQLMAALVVFLVLLGLGLLLLPLVVRLLGRVLAGKKESRTDTKRLTLVLHRASDAPLRVLVVLFALGMASRILLLRASDTTTVTVLSIGVVLAVVWAVLRLIDSVVVVYADYLRKRYPNLRGELVNFLSNLARLTVILLTVLYLLHDMGYDITTLLASLGIGGLAIAFAAKESIANIFGCVSIIADDMFRQGDWIVTADANGTVIDVGLRSTKIRTFDNAVIFIPNAYLAGVAVRNWSRRKLGRRIDFTVGVEYGSDMKMVRKTVDDIRAMLTAHPGVADSSTDTSQYSQQQLTKIANAMDSHGVMQTLLVYLDELGESSINIMVYCFSKSVNWQEWLEVKQDVIFRCCDIVAANGLSIAFPSRTLYLRDAAMPAPDDATPRDCAASGP
jgi:MscS family membrane protein